MVSLTWYFRWINFLDICLISHGSLINGVKMLAFAEHYLPARCPSGLYVCWFIRFLQPCEAGALVIPFYRSREKQWPCPRSHQGSGRTETESHRLQSPVSVNYMFSQVTRFFPSTVPRAVCSQIHREPSLRPLAAHSLAHPKHSWWRGASHWGAQSWEGRWREAPEVSADSLVGRNTPRCSWK